MEKGIIINYMAVSSWNMRMGALGGANTRTVRRRGMGHMRVLMVSGTLGYIKRMPCTCMGYTGGLMEMYIMANGNRINKMAMGIKVGELVAMNIQGNGKIISSGERESNRRKGNYLKIYMKKTS
jgi:hypothetical protein